MSEEVTLCPFCGQPLDYHSYTIWGEPVKVYQCVNLKCWLHHRTTALENWQKRPVEDQLRARIAEAIADEKKDAETIEQLRGELARLHTELEKAHEDDVFHVIAHRVALRKTVDALEMFCDPEHGVITRKNWEMVHLVLGVAREVLQ